jgi:hypothetical protein
LGKRADKNEPVLVLRLHDGAHDRPRDGICVVELASLLAGERFSDRPRCVCEVIAAFLRAWNDRAGYADRQRLAPYAARIIGTRGPRETTRMRRDLCLAATGVDLGGSGLRRLRARLGARLRILVLLGLRPGLRLGEGSGELAARVIFARQDEEAAFSLLDRLLRAGGSGSEAAPLANPVAASPQERVAAAIRELAGDTQVPHREQGRNGGNGNGHAGNVLGRDAGQRDEEHVEHDGTSGDDPERDPKVAEHSHAGKS